METWKVDRDDDYAVTVDLGPDMEWVAVMQWPEGVTQGGPAVLVIYPSDPDTYPPGGISQTVLRDIDFKHAIDRLRSRLQQAEFWRSGRQESEERVRAVLTAHAAEPRVTDTYLALLSRTYVAAVNAGQDKPLQHLAKVTGKTDAAIKNHLWKATRNGLLERSPGRVGGSVTPKAAALVEAALSG